MKHRGLIRDVVAALANAGHEPLFPNLDHPGGDLTQDEKKRLALEHYAAIDASDVVYFLTPEGYMGTSCKLELGYTIAAKKTVFFSEPTNDQALDCYVSAFVAVADIETSSIFT